ncbi:hypothetical protein KKF61_08810, partial [Patescibacteria group bacterium]|nr:hypothetical protein [Patescibacteria group bacterium]
MIQITIGDYLQPIIDWVIYWCWPFLQLLITILSNPIIIGLIILYIVARFTKWYLKRQKEKKELEYLQKPSYEEVERRLHEKEEELRALRRR